MKEIFFLSLLTGRLMAVPVESGEDFFRAGTPPLFQTRLNLYEDLMARSLT